MGSSIGVATGMLLLSHGGDIPMGIIAPFSGLSPVSFTAASGALIWAVTGLVVANIVDRREQARRREKVIRRPEPVIVPLTDDIDEAA